MNPIALLFEYKAIHQSKDQNKLNVWLAKVLDYINNFDAQQSVPDFTDMLMLIKTPRPDAISVYKCGVKDTLDALRHENEKAVG
ncbi:MAG: hypothetical protein PHF86_05080 [Candidatus Nanoarchaeia archaeon]|nr:hypothetical protein [Candidatus Nanoarchaeia archaeon]